MPSPRAVLADLKNLKLDTRKAWSAVGVNGHLKGEHSHVTTEKKVEVVVAAEKTELKETAPVISVEQEVLHAHEEVLVVAEPEVQQPIETAEEAQDVGLELENLENDFFRSKKKKKLTA